MIVGFIIISCYDHTLLLYHGWYTVCSIVILEWYNRWHVVHMHVGVHYYRWLFVLAPQGSCIVRLRYGLREILDYIYSYWTVHRQSLAEVVNIRNARSLSCTISRSLSVYLLHSVLWNKTSEGKLSLPSQIIDAPSIIYDTVSHRWSLLKFERENYSSQIIFLKTDLNSASRIL